MADKLLFLLTLGAFSIHAWAQNQACPAEIYQAHCVASVVRRK